MKQPQEANSNLAELYHQKFQQLTSRTWSECLLAISIICLVCLIVAANVDTAAFSGLTMAMLIASLVLTYCVYEGFQHGERFKLHSRVPAVRSPAPRVLRGSDEPFRDAFNHAAGMALVAPDGRWLKVNRSLCETLGYTEQELLVLCFQDVVHPDDLSAFHLHLRKLLSREISNYQAEQRYIQKQGHTVWVLLNAALVCDTEGKPSHFVFQIQNITERKHIEERLVHDVFHDALTGLPNRALFMDRLILAIERTKRRQGRIFALLFLDLDEFKLINDRMGHIAGDQLLIEIARKLRACLRSVDTVARLGGDEFTILLEDVNEESEVVHIVKRIQNDLGHAVMLNSREVVATASIGIALSTTGYERASDMLRDADTALYRAKSEGKARYEVFEKSMNAPALNFLELKAELRAAVDNEELLLHYQPIVSLSSGALTGFEALVRWNHPQRGLVSPVDFIPMAEDAGLISAIGRWVLYEACRQMRSWQEQFALHPYLSISVNLSGKQFAQPDLIDQVIQALQETGLDPRMLKLEITESAVMENLGTAITMLQQLRALGVELGLDDFGTGYSSLSYLHRLPIDMLKIDRSFVGLMTKSEDNEEIIKTIITLARSVNMKVVAEGVETLEQLTQLRLLKCDEAQGYLFSRPIAADAAGNLILKRDQWQVEMAALGAADQVDSKTIPHTAVRGMPARTVLRAVGGPNQ